MHQSAKDILAVKDPTRKTQRDWLRETATKKDIDEFLALTGDSEAFQSMALSELQRRHANKKPHWTMTPGFIVMIITMVFAAIAAWPVIRQWIPASQPASK